MANLTFADYVSTSLAYLNEDRDNPSNNQMTRETDVKRAINAGRLAMLREVGVGLYRTSETMNATSGDIAPPDDFFGAAILRYAPNSTTRTTLRPVSVKYMSEKNPMWQLRTGTPSEFIWSVSADGITVTLSPAPESTITDGLIWDYTATLADLSADTDTCPVMNLFPEFQLTTLQSGACRLLTLLEGGEADDQFQKWSSIFASDCEKIRAQVKQLFVSDSQLLVRS